MPGPGKPFQKGNKLAKGGPRPGGGAPTDWLRAKCRKIVERAKLIEFLAQVASGKDMEQVVTDQGQVLRVPASVKDRIRATVELLDRGFGKVAQPLTDADGGPITVNIIKYG